MILARTSRLFKDTGGLIIANSLLYEARQVQVTVPPQCRRDMSRVGVLGPFLNSEYPELKIVGLGLTMSVVRSAGREELKQVQLALAREAPYISKLIPAEEILRLQLHLTEPPRDLHPALAAMFMNAIIDIQSGGNPHLVPPANDEAVRTAGFILRKLFCTTGLELVYSAAVGSPKNELLELFIEAKQMEAKYMELMDGIVTLQVGESVFYFPARVGKLSMHSGTLDRDCATVISRITAWLDNPERFNAFRKLLPKDAGTRTIQELAAIFRHNSAVFARIVDEPRSPQQQICLLIEHSDVRESDVTLLGHFLYTLPFNADVSSQEKRWTKEERIAVLGLMLAEKVLIEEPIAMLGS